MKNLNASGKMVRAAECKDLTYEEIEQCIEGEAVVEEIIMERGLFDASELILGQVNFIV